MLELFGFFLGMFMVFLCGVVFFGGVICLFICLEFGLGVVCFGFFFFVI